MADKRRAEVLARLVGADMSDPDLHDFADSAEGRSISETVMREGVDQELSDMAMVLFRDFKGKSEQASAIEDRTQQAATPDNILDELEGD
jgi:hypothetical protein